MKRVLVSIAMIVAASGVFGQPIVTQSTIDSTNRISMRALAQALAPQRQIVILILNKIVVPIAQQR